MSDTPSSYDEERDVDDVESTTPPRLDPEADEADQLDQSRTIQERVIQNSVDRSPEVPEADAIEQAMGVPGDDDEDLRD